MRRGFISACGTSGTGESNPRKAAIWLSETTHGWCESSRFKIGNQDKNRYVWYRSPYAQLSLGAVNCRLRPDSNHCFDAAQSIHFLVTYRNIEDVSIRQEKVGSVAF